MNPSFHWLPATSCNSTRNLAAELPGFYIAWLTELAKNLIPAEGT
jgi:hypothetical protein